MIDRHGRKVYWEFFSRKWLGLLAVCSSTPLPIPAADATAKFESSGDGTE